MRAYQGCIGKHETPPRHLEGHSVAAPDVLPQGPDTDEEPPHAQPPQPQRHQHRDDLDDVGRVRRPEEVGRYDGVGLGADLRYAGGREPEGTDGDEDTGSLHVPGQLLGHQAVDEGSGYHEGNQAAGALGRDGAQRDGGFVYNKTLVRRALGGYDELAGEGGGQQERVGGEDPCRRHHMDGKDA